MIVRRNRIPRDPERGAVATIVALLLAGGVVMGMLALSVDVGNAWWERRQLQNGADATSVALAKECAKDLSNCKPVNVADLLPKNSTAADRTAQYLKTPVMPDGACQRNAVGSGLPECPSATTNASYDQLAQCPPLPDWLKTAKGANTPYVETYSRTDSTQTDKTILPAYFSQMLLGGAGGPVRVTACARAAWGPIGSSRPSLPLVIGLCNWNQATQSGNRLMQSPPYTPAPNTGGSVPALLDKNGVLQQPKDFITMIFGQLNGSEDLSKFPCNPQIDNPPGAYGPGGFGWLKTCGQLGASEPACAGQPPCYAPIPGSGQAGGGTGSALPTDCKYDLATFVGQEVDIPVVTAVTGTGSNLTYTVDGVSTFFLAGYHNVTGMQPQDKDAYRVDAPSYVGTACTDSSGTLYKSTCMWGWFTSPVRSGGTIDPTVTPRGPIQVQPAG